MEQSDCVWVRYDVYSKINIYRTEEVTTMKTTKKNGVPFEKVTQKDNCSVTLAFLARLGHSLLSLWSTIVALACIN